MVGVAWSSPCACLTQYRACPPPQLEPEELAGLRPRDLSYWVASFFADIKVLQQSVSGAGCVCVCGGGDNGAGQQG